jgi:hypothetical protein
MTVRRKKAQILRWLAVCSFRTLENTDQDELVSAAENLDGDTSLSGE